MGFNCFICQHITYACSPVYNQFLRWQIVLITLFCTTIKLDSISFVYFMLRSLQKGSGGGGEGNCQCIFYKNLPAKFSFGMFSYSEVLFFSSVCLMMFTSNIPRYICRFFSPKCSHNFLLAFIFPPSSLHYKHIRITVTSFRLNIIFHNVVQILYWVEVRLVGEIFEQFYRGQMLS